MESSLAHATARGFLRLSGMAKKINKSMLLGDYGFREKYLGMCPDAIRAQVFKEARERIAHSAPRVRFFEPAWPWLRAAGND